MTFHNQKERKIENIKLEIKSLIEQQKSNFSTLIKLEDNSFLVAIQFMDIDNINKQIIHLETICTRLNRFDIVKSTQKIKHKDGTKRLKSFNVSSNNNWTDTVECSEKQMTDIAKFEKKLFYHTLVELTNNKALSDTYTKYFFSSSVAHHSKK